MAAESLRAFYDLSREMVALERDRFEQAEEKSWRFVSIWNFRVALTLEPPIDRSVAEFARGSSIERFHLELGREFMRAAAENRRVANFRFLILATILGIVLGALFYLLPDPS